MRVCCRSSRRGKHLCPGLVPKLLQLLSSAPGLIGRSFQACTQHSQRAGAHLWSVVKVILSVSGRKPRYTMVRFAGLHHQAAVKCCRRNHASADTKRTCCSCAQWPAGRIWILGPVPRLPATEGSVPDMDELQVALWVAKPWTPTLSVFSSCVFQAAMTKLKTICNSFCFDGHRCRIARQDARWSTCSGLPVTCPSQSVLLLAQVLPGQARRLPAQSTASMSAHVCYRQFLLFSTPPTPNTLNWPIRDQMRTSWTGVLPNPASHTTAGHAGCPSFSR